MKSLFTLRLSARPNPLFEEKNISLADSHISESDFIESVLTESVLTESVLTESVLTESVLTESVLTESVLTESVLTESVLTESVLTESEFTCLSPQICMNLPVLESIVLYARTKCHELYSMRAQSVTNW